MSQSIYWCRVHNSASDEADGPCHWNKWAGPRPGRGACQIELMELHQAGQQ